MEFLPKKLIKIMIRAKLIAIAMLLGISGANATLWSQGARMDFSARDVSMAELFTELEKKTSLSFIFVHEDVKGFTTSVEAEGKTLAEILDVAFTSKPLSYRITNEHVVIYRRAQQPPAAAQTGPITVRGMVVDEAGHPVIGAAVTVKNTFVGASTDASGRFTIGVSHPDGAVLNVSYIGMRSVEVPVERNKTEYEIQLTSDVANLDAVVVTGYGERSRSSFTGAASVITGEQLLSVGTKSVFQSLAAFVPGLQLIENNEMGSDPNTLPEILVRGRSSFTEGSNVPTFVVDGAEVSLSYIFDLDMNDIESVTVLKDASATALYGSKAANGVFVITTKPMIGGRMKVNYNGTFRLATPDLSDYDLLNAAEKLDYEQRAGLYTSDYGKTQYELDERYNAVYQRVREGVDTDWLHKPLRNTVATNHSLSIYGGEGNVRYNLGLRYGNDRGVMKNSDRKRYALTYKLTYNLGEKLFFQNQTTINSVNNRDVPYGSFSDFAEQNPYDKPYNDDGSYNLSLSYKKKNPLYEASLGSYDRGENFYINNTFDVKFLIIDDLRLEGSFAFTKHKNDNEAFLSPRSQEFDGKPEDEKGHITVSNTKQMDYQGKLILSWNKMFDHGTLLNVAGGANISQDRSDSNGYMGIGIFSDKQAHPAFSVSYPAGQSPSGSQSISRALGFFVTSNVIFRDRYFADLSFRSEGSSKFGSDNRFGTFWALGAGWNIHKESFMRMNENDRLKLRGSIGYVGNASFSPYQAMTIYEYLSDLFYGKGIGATPITIGNTDLRYEKALNINVGLDLNILNNRWDMTLDFYQRTTDNLLIDNTKAPSIGVASAMENVGKVRNMGVEFRTRVTVIRNSDWDWSLSLNATHNKNKIQKISDALKVQNELNNGQADNEQLRKPIPYFVEGESLSALKVVRSGGIDPLTGREIYITLDGTRTFIYDFRDKVLVGDTDPKVYGSVSSFLRWKGFQLNMVFGYNLGATVYNSTLVSKVEGSDPRNNADRRVLEERWKEPGDYAKYRDIANIETPQQTDRFTQDEYTFTMRTLSLAYDFPQNISRKLGMSRLRAELLTNDVFRFSTIKQERGLTYPFARTYELSLSINF